jgi:hypothetical protein
LPVSPVFIFHIDIRKDGFIVNSQTKSPLQPVKINLLTQTDYEPHLLVSTGAYKKLDMVANFSPDLFGQAAVQIFNHYPGCFYDLSVDKRKHYDHEPKIEIMNIVWICLAKNNYMVHAKSSEAI